MANQNVPPLSHEFLLKRGGSGTNALTNTLDPSLYPTTPPVSEFDSGVPKIGGSEGGFIGLIVVFVVLIILCCCAVFYLLHNRGDRPGGKNYPLTASSTPGPTGIFASRRKKNAGWVQQGDEFDYDSADDEDLAGGKGAAQYGDGGSGYTGQHDKLKTLSSPPALSRGVDADAYTDPFDPERLPESVRRQQAPLPRTSREPEEAPHNPVDRSHKESPTTPLYEGGSKFREQF